ncbi:MAG: aspartate aminotransferase family protein [Vicingaceae bacterium]|nr:MAG: aspartate aminotransferase family protein [Vicingaceae bacterium]
MIHERQLFLEYLAQTSDFPMMLQPAKSYGIYIEDVNGKKYIDGISGISVSNTGHLHPEIRSAVEKQMNLYDHLMVYGEYVQSPQVRLAQLLAGMLDGELKVTYFLNSGSEAIELALKLAKRYTGRFELVSFKNTYHGSTHGAMSLMSNFDYTRNFRPLLPGVVHLPYNDHKALDYITDKTAGVVVEFIQAEAGVMAASKDWIKKLKEKCESTGTLLIADEIQTGVGRTGKWWAYKHYGIVPDILVLGKAFGFGFPLSAVVSSSEIMGVLRNNPVLGHITTFGGHPVCCAAAEAGFNFLKKKRTPDKLSRRKKQHIFYKTLTYPCLKIFAMPDSCLL